jgi:hypothetical protein
MFDAVESIMQREQVQKLFISRLAVFVVLGS